MIGGLTIKVCGVTRAADVAQPDPAAYASFNEFFTRPLKPGARPLAPADWISPVDGAISQFGLIARDQVFQAKGHSYSTTALVGGDSALAAQFENGHFATLYLSPKDYHRIHMPCDGRLLRMVHVPGELFSVNPTTARGVPGLFARNERLVCVFENEQLGRWVLVLVGATIVGSMATVWHGVVNPPPGTWTVRYAGTNLTFNRPDALAPSRLVIPLPTVTVSNGNLTSISWVYKDAATGTTLNQPPAFVTNMEIEVDTVNGQAADLPDLPPNSNNGVSLFNSCGYCFW